MVFDQFMLLVISHFFHLYIRTRICEHEINSHVATPMGTFTPIRNYSDEKNIKTNVKHLPFYELIIGARSAR